MSKRKATRKSSTPEERLKQNAERIAKLQAKDALLKAQAAYRAAIGKK